MPVYQVATPAGAVPRGRWPQIAEELARIHCSLTGDAPEFAQVLFLEIPAGAAFLMGRISPMVNVSVYIRAGRPAEVREKWMREIHECLVRQTAVEPGHVKITLFEVPAQSIMQGGRIMPEIGHDREWLAQGREPILP